MLNYSVAELRIKKPSFAKLDYNSVIHFYIESSGSMNGFFRAGQPTGFKQDVYEVMSYYAGLTKDINIMTRVSSSMFSFLIMF